MNALSSRQVSDKNIYLQSSISVRYVELYGE